MALIEKSEETLKRGEKDELEFDYLVHPDVEREIEHEQKKINLAVSLPGVKKEHISLKVLPTWFHLEGYRDKILYSANQSFGTEIIPEETRAKYDNGLLRIMAKIKDPLADARELDL